MRICLIADATSIHTLRWAEYFVNQGDEVHIVTYEPPKNELEGVKFHIIRSIFNNLYLDFFPRHLRMYLLIHKMKPDILHAHFISKFGFHAAFLGYRPLIMSAWGGDILVVPYWSKLLWYLTGISLRRTDMVYGVSKDICEKIVTNFRVSSSRVKLVPFGVDTKLFHPAAEKNIVGSNDLVVFSNRTFLEIYNIETLVNSIPLVVEKNPNIKFVIKGTGPLEDSLKSLVLELGVSQYVTFIGWVEYKEMAGLLHNCDIYVSTALSDGTPVSVLEAMACAKPCIVTDVGGVSEWIDDGLNGCLFTPRNPQELAQKILELAANSIKRDKFGKNALKVIEERGDWQRIMTDVRTQYKELVRGHEIH
ncbi:glycosyltransferase family 4 protein [uncultured Methanomethylovorans sp.]|uniref:glycosyltransferase family 4 protein n=1 Tax=uncultured Methanomethylovorans sp. TaxID=183759 RepID=UPI002AA719DD|nr:glycosyltransferase family 4 protein [uncultured Methanomethylovorans sp.]